MARAATVQSGGPVRRQLSIARVMFWIAGAAILMAAYRSTSEQHPLGAMIFSMTLLALALDLSLTVLKLIFGTDAVTSNQGGIGRIEVPGGLRAMVEGVAIPVELIRWPVLRIQVGPPLERAISRDIDGHAFLCQCTAQTVEPFDLLDRGPILVQHDYYGICLVSPVSFEPVDPIDEAALPPACPEHIRDPGPGEAQESQR